MSKEMQQWGPSVDSLRFDGDGNDMGEIRLNLGPHKDDPADAAQESEVNSSWGKTAARAALGLLSENAAADAKPSSKSIWSLSYYQAFFDITTVEVGKRLLKTLLPIGPTWGPFFENGATPDLYGPFWTASTLILLMAAVGNFANYLEFLPTDEKAVWQYDFEKFTLAATVFYSIISIVPLVVWIILKRLNVAVDLTEVIALYGYSVFVYVPATIICVLPIESLRWLALFVTFAVSTSFLVRNLWNFCLIAADESPVHKKTLTSVMMGVAGVHGLLALVVKFYFFQL